MGGVSRRGQWGAVEAGAECGRGFHKVESPLTVPSSLPDSGLGNRNTFPSSLPDSGVGNRNTNTGLAARENRLADGRRIEERGSARQALKHSSNRRDLA